MGDGPVWSADVSFHGTGQPGRFFNLIEGERGAIMARHPDFGSGYLKDVGCTNNATQLSCPAGVLPPGMAAADASVFANVGGNWFTATLSASSVSSDATGVNVSFEPGGDQYRANNKVYLQGPHQLVMASSMTSLSSFWLTSIASSRLRSRKSSWGSPALAGGSRRSVRRRWSISSYFL